MRLNNPELSILIPVYNSERYLGKCLDSILNQKFSSFEVVLVDDGSTDQSGKICDDYCEMDTRIQVIHKSNGGLGSARIAGINSANGKYIGFLDSDDWVSSDMYEELIKLIYSDNDCDIVIGGYVEDSNDYN